MGAQGIAGRFRAWLTHLRELISGEDLADAQQYRTDDLPDWLVPGGSGRQRGGSRRKRRKGA